MADIFISYAREDHDCARVLAETLSRRGWTVWWDRDLYGGENFDRVIAREIANARAVIVIWSAASVDSEYVMAEAVRAQKLKKLLPTRIDDAELPLRFETIHTVDLSPWLAPARPVGRARDGSEAAKKATKSLFRDLQHYLGERPSVAPRNAPKSKDDQPRAPRQEPAAPSSPIEFRWDERRHRKSYDTFGIVEDNDLVVVKMPPQLSDDAGGAGTVIKKGLVVPKPV